MSPHRPHSQFRIDFFNSAIKHDLTPAQQEEHKKFYRLQLTIGSLTMRELAEDWFSRVGLRFRIKPRLFIRIARAAMRPVFG